MGFDRLGLSEATLKAVSLSGYQTPTPIQSQAIPQILMGRDILGIAQTGTGKTASFTLPMIDILSEGRARARMPRTLILEPTRELAAQVSENFETYGKYHKLTMALLIGGVNFADQDKLLDRGVDVLIATPGRLLDHMERGKLMLTGISILVVDEADRMLDMGFIPDVEKICERIPKNHQTLFFSATMPPPIERLSKKFLNDPKLIEVAAPSSAASTITQGLVWVDGRSKRRILRQFIRSSDIQNGIIFCNRKKDVKDVYESLQRHGFDSAQLHGDLAQSERLVVLDLFKKGGVKLLVASDVAARGLDIPAVGHVFNFDVPTHAEDYVHRIGRTGRAGREGVAITLGVKNGDDRKYVGFIEKLIGKTIPVLPSEPKGPAPEKALPTSNQSSLNQSGPKQHPRGQNQPSPNQTSTANRGNANRAERPTQNRPSHQGTRPQTGGSNPDRIAENNIVKTQKPMINNLPRDRRRWRDQDENIPSVIGLGDHVPYFLTIDPLEKS